MVPVVAVVVFATLAALVPQTDAHYRKNLTEGEKISNGQYLMIPDSSSFVPPWLAMQRDCNFVLYDQVGQPAWNTVTELEGVAGSCYATVKDCVLLINDGRGNKPTNTIWSSDTAGKGKSPCFLTISLAKGTHAPTAVLFDSTHAKLWSSPPPAR